MRILLVEDDRESRAGVAEFLRDLGHQVVECADGRTALSTFIQGDFPLVLSDIKMPEMSGLQLLRALTDLPAGREAAVVLYTGYGDLDMVIEALRAGAYDYLLKPINIEELAILVERIAEHQALRQENKVLTTCFAQEVKAVTEETRQEISRLRKMVAQFVGLGEIGIFSQSMNLIVRQAKKYHTDRSIPVLIQGETGTGKEVIAKIIHYNQMVSTTPFVDINCAAVTPSLAESELFGYEPGTFTGGLVKGQKGKLDLAQGGTLFLDEIGELPLAIQGKLLRVIQEKEYYRVGGLKKIKTDVRIICATNVDLAKKVAEGSFRKDLYYRLKVGHLVLPPLCQRREDILPLAGMFLRRFSRQKGKRFNRISDAAAKIMLHYLWPGNVRELRNAMEWAVFMHDAEELHPDHLGSLTEAEPVTRVSVMNGLPPILDPVQFTLPVGAFPLEDHYNAVLVAALKMHKGNKTETAKYLGLTRRALYSRLARLNVPFLEKE
ncbi:MAG: sigma-54 dependent transcriptional regulator [Heliobacteriaceae bacterium]|nr:sigma-54 dependent transcriptional regulator [Heliobacteriaceae bacterium]MDD4588535.1 sigma-54 dependent transcriptional regulator [Heliobacteriaceae bacterium]